MWQHCQGTTWLLPRQSHMALLLPATSKRLAIIKECQSQTFEHLGSILMSLFGEFHLCCRRASVKSLCYLQQLKQPSRGVLCRTFQGMKVAANSMSRLYSVPGSWEDTTDPVSPVSRIPSQPVILSISGKREIDFLPLYMWVIIHTEFIQPCYLQNPGNYSFNLVTTYPR